MEKFELKNNIVVTLERDENAPNAALSCNFALNGIEKIPGTFELMGRLLTRVHKSIELRVETHHDFLSLDLICTNEELPLALELLSDTIKNPTFETFEKSKVEMREDIVSKLDSDKSKTLDNYNKTIFEGHFYSHTHSKILESLDKITKEDIEKAYEQIFSGSKKVLSIVADTDFEQIKPILEKTLGSIKNDVDSIVNLPQPSLNQSKTIEIIKNGIQKSQIVQGWIFPTYNSEDYPSICVLNVILGHDGLCSRLFLELRGKQDIVYAVRSSYDTYKLCASFNIYISTDAKNIQKVLDGASKEIQKLKQAEVDDIELDYAKKILLTKHRKIRENNSERAKQLAYFETIGLSSDFQDQVMEKIKLVRAKQIQECAIKYFDVKSVVSLLRAETI